MDDVEDRRQARPTWGPSGAGATRHRPSGREARAEGGFGLVEALIAFVLLAVGMLAIAGLALSTAAQTRTATDVTQQALATQQAMEVWTTSGYSQVPTGTKDTTISLAGREFTVTRSVSQIAPRVKEIEASVEGAGSDDQRTIVSRLHDARTP